MSLGVPPFILVAAAGALAAVICGVIAWRAESRFVAAVMLVLAPLFTVPAAYLFVVLHPELVDGRFRTYKAFYADIQIGMTREQVLGAMEAHYPKSAPRQPPKVIPDDVNELGFLMNPEHSREPNCEGILLKLVNGRVASKRYSAD